MRDLKNNRNKRSPREKKQNFTLYILHAYFLYIFCSTKESSGAASRRLCLPHGVTNEIRQHYREIATLESSQFALSLYTRPDHPPHRFCVRALRGAVRNVIYIYIHLQHPISFSLFLHFLAYAIFRT